MRISKPSSLLARVKLRSDQTHPISKGGEYSIEPMLQFKSDHEGYSVKLGALFAVLGSPSSEESVGVLFVVVSLVDAFSRNIWISRLPTAESSLFPIDRESKYTN